MNTVTLYEKFNSFPLGRYLFSKVLCFKAPYFGTISPLIKELRPGLCIVEIRKRRSITNHIKTVHAIAMCNLAELCGGLAIDASLPKELRWIPKGMTVRYLKKAETNLVGICELDMANIQEGDNIVQVKVQNIFGQIVFDAEITMYVSKKK